MVVLAVARLETVERPPQVQEMKAAHKGVYNLI